jgi:hypothetical protein
MTAPRRARTAGLALMLAGCLLAGTVSAAPKAPKGCQLGADDQAWIDQALANWDYAAAKILRLPPVPLPQVVAVDGRCQANALPVSGKPIGWKGRLHGGEIWLPDNNKVPVGVLSFASPDEKGPRGGFFVMSMPSVWRTGGVTSELGLEALMEGVLLHEMMHTRQFASVNPHLSALARQYGLPDDINDDSVQRAFEGDADYVHAFRAETDLLYAAAAAPDDVTARRLAREALAAMRERHARWFTGANAQWAPLDDVFLQMEGLGQWLIYTWYVDGPRYKLAPDVAVRAVRRGKKQWSQDEGLALMLVVDRLVPDWRARAFADKPAFAEELLALAAR